MHIIEETVLAAQRLNPDGAWMLSTHVPVPAACIRNMLISMVIPYICPMMNRRKKRSRRSCTSKPVSWLWLAQ
ncbi:MAG: hypothetical protein LUC29_07075 [Acidaminococcaceae bacterium]|nr:hypothetical protein [Acidaminococcaceae bacterium]